MGMKVARLEHNSGLQGWPGREKSEVDSTLAYQHLAWASLPSDQMTTCALWLCGQMRDWGEVGTGVMVGQRATTHGCRGADTVKILLPWHSSYTWKVQRGRVLHCTSGSCHYAHKTFCTNVTFAKLLTSGWTAQREANLTQILLMK